MRKISYFLALSLLSSQLFATYIVVLKNGTRYRAKDRWTVSNGKAIVQLENGTTIQLDPNLIDVARSEEATRSGLGDAKVLSTPGQQPAARAPQPSLGDTIRIRRQQQQDRPAQPTVPLGAPPSGAAPAVVAPAGPGMLGTDVSAKFVSAYENVGFFESKITPSAPYTLRVELVADNEDQVFKAISATAYVMLRVPTLTNRRLDTVELFLGTMAGGAAGRFQMTQDDARALDAKTMTIEQYYIKKVLF